MDEKEQLEFFSFAKPVMVDCEDNQPPKVVGKSFFSNIGTMPVTLAVMDNGTVSITVGSQTCGLSKPFVSDLKKILAAGVDGVAVAEK
jgi:hypothetical protein